MTKLRDILPPDVLRKLQTHFGGSKVYVPKAELDDRNRKIQEAHFENTAISYGKSMSFTASVEDLSQRFALSPRQIIRILAEGRKDRE